MALTDEQGHINIGQSPTSINHDLFDGSQLKFADFFCGIGGFHLAASALGMKCVFACDIDLQAQETYHANFNIRPVGDISKIKATNVPDHDLLFAGFPCQPFSIIGKQNGFADPRGTLFFDLLKIIKEKKPMGIILENVKQLATADKGRIIERILKDLENTRYEVDYKILNALNFGLPQKRERTIIVGSLTGLKDFSWPEQTITMRPLSEFLEIDPDDRFFVSKRIRKKRASLHKPMDTPSIWHENKSGNVSSYPYSCALRAGASHNYLLVDGERRLTPRENLRLQGFPDSFKIVCTDAQVKKQAGNAVAVPVVQAVMGRLEDVIRRSEITGECKKAL